MNIFMKICLIVVLLEQYAANDCKFSIKRQIPVTPLILHNQREPKLLYPTNYNTLQIPAGQQIRVSCVDKKFKKFKAREVVATCVRNDIVRVRKQEMHFKDLECTDFPRSTVRSLDVSCYRNGTLHEIGFPVRRLYLRLILACFNKHNYTSTYVYTNSSYLYTGHASGVPRVTFEHDKMYSFNISEKFHTTYQRQTLKKLLKSEKLANKYVKNDGQYFMSRGHLAAKSDFVYGSEQAATFHYVNAAPQWQIFNGGNWVEVEQSVQNHIVKAGADNYGVATGTYGVALLPDKDNVQQELYLHTDTNNNTVFTVPKFYWKIVYDKKKKVGDVIIGVNNPHLKEITKEYQLCKNICNSIKWLKVKKNSIQRGHIYCCDMDEFLKTIKMENMFNRKI